MAYSYPYGTTQPRSPFRYEATRPSLTSTTATTVKAKPAVGGKKDRKPMVVPRPVSSGSFQLNFAENPGLSVTFGATTRSVLVRLLPYPVKDTPWQDYRIMVDLGAKNMWEATTGVLREACALAAYPLHYRPVHALDNRQDVASMHLCYRPLLMGLASQIRRHITVILLNDSLLTRGGGADQSSISILSSLPRDAEVGADYAILRSIKQGIFIYVVMASDGTFYPLIILLKGKEKDTMSWHRFLPQTLLLDYPMDQGSLLGLYTKCIARQ